MLNPRFIRLAALGSAALWTTPVLAQDARSVETDAAAGIELPLRDAGEGIINGEDAARDDYPMTGGLLMSATIVSSWFGGDIQTFICSSTLIAPDVVLTAAHCVDMEMLELSMTLGTGTLEDVVQVWSRDADLSSYDGQSAELDWPADAVTVIGTVYPTSWSASALQTGLADNNDIALMFLSEPVLDVMPAFLPTSTEGAALVEGLEVAVVGWGQQTHTSGWSAPPAGSYMLKQQGMSFVAELGAPEFKVGEVEGDVRKCHGDSGGPSFAWVGTDSEESMRLVGVTSHAYDRSDCASTGGVDTRVDYHLDWIDAQMRAACDDGLRVWCDEPGILPADYFEISADGDSGLADSESGDEVDGSDSDGTGKSGCSHAAGALSGFGLVLSMVAVARRRD
jgi:hypothetical protein